MVPSGLSDTEQLLRDRAWLTRLARALTADDASGGIMLGSHSSSRRDHRSLRRWVEAMARGVSRLTRRSDSRCLNWAPTTSEVSAEEAMAGAELRLRVLDAVLGLAEPFRSSVVLCVLEAKSYAAVGKITRTELEAVCGRVVWGLLTVKYSLGILPSQRRVDCRADSDAARTVRIARLRRFASIAPDEGFTRGTSE